MVPRPRRPHVASTVSAQVFFRAFRFLQYVFCRGRVDLLCELLHDPYTLSSGLPQVSIFD
jgi:hypothetical protein